MYPRLHIPTVIKWKKRFLSLQTAEEKNEWIEKKTAEKSMRNQVRPFCPLTSQWISYIIAFSTPRLSVTLLRLIMRVWPHKRLLQQMQECQCACPFSTSYACRILTAYLGWQIARKHLGGRTRSSFRETTLFPF